MTTPNDRMPEAEVTLKLAFRLYELEPISSPVCIAIDGACVQIGDKCIFPMAEFLGNHGWRRPVPKSKGWAGECHKDGMRMKIGSRSGPDLQRKWHGKLLRVESKGGRTSNNRKCSATVAGAIGQMMMLPDLLDTNEERWIALPNTEAFKSVCIGCFSRFIEHAGLKFALVARSGAVTLIESRITIRTL